MKPLISTVLRKVVPGAILLTMAASVNAGFILSLDDTSTAGIDAIIVDDVDGGIGYITPLGPTNFADTTAGDGLITFNMAVGNFSVNVTTGLSKPIIGQKTDLNSVNVSGAAGTLVLMLTDTDFSQFGTKFMLDIGGTTDGTVRAQAFLDPANAEFGMTNMTPELVFGPGAFSGSTSANLLSPITGPYSLTQKVTIVHTAAGQITSFDAIDPVPEPSALALMGLGLFGIGFSKLRKKS